MQWQRQRMTRRTAAKSFTLVDLFGLPKNEGNEEEALVAEEPHQKEMKLTGFSSLSKTLLNTDIFTIENIVFNLSKTNGISNEFLSRLLNIVFFFWRGFVCERSNYSRCY